MRIRPSPVCLVLASVQGAFALYPIATTALAASPTSDDCIQIEGVSARGPVELSVAAASDSIICHLFSDAPVVSGPDTIRSIPAVAAAADHVQFTATETEYALLLGQLMQSAEREKFPIPVTGSRNDNPAFDGLLEPEDGLDYWDGRLAEWQLEELERRQEVTAATSISAWAADVRRLLEASAAALRAGVLYHLGRLACEGELLASEDASDCEAATDTIALNIPLRMVNERCPGEFAPPDRAKCLLLLSEHLLSASVHLAFAKNAWNELSALSKPFYGSAQRGIGQAGAEWSMVLEHAARLSAADADFLDAYSSLFVALAERKAMQDMLCEVSPILVHCRYGVNFSSWIEPLILAIKMQLEFDRDRVFTIGADGVGQYSESKKCVRFSCFWLELSRGGLVEQKIAVPRLETIETPAPQLDERLETGATADPSSDLAEGEDAPEDRQSVERRPPAPDSPRPRLWVEGGEPIFLDIPASAKPAEPGDDGQAGFSDQAASGGDPVRPKDMRLTFDAGRVNRPIGSECVSAKRQDVSSDLEKLEPLQDLLRNQADYFDKLELIAKRGGQNAKAYAALAEAAGQAEQALSIAQWVHARQKGDVENEKIERNVLVLTVVCSTLGPTIASKACGAATNAVKDGLRTLAQHGIDPDLVMAWAAEDARAAVSPFDHGRMPFSYIATTDTGRCERASEAALREYTKRQRDFRIDQRRRSACHLLKNKLNLSCLRN